MRAARLAAWPAMSMARGGRKGRLVAPTHGLHLSFAAGFWGPCSGEFVSVVLGSVPVGKG